MKNLEGRCLKVHLKLTHNITFDIFSHIIWLSVKIATFFAFNHKKLVLKAARFAHILNLITEFFVSYTKYQNGLQLKDFLLKLLSKKLISKTNKMFRSAINTF